MAAPDGHSYLFGPFRISVSERLLFRGDHLVPLTPKALDLLVVLVESKGQLLTKEELMKQVWPDSFVEEANLSHNIYKLREALGDGADGEKFIETLPRRGYRFVAKVVQENDRGTDLIIEEHSRAQLIIEDDHAEQQIIETPARRSPNAIGWFSIPRLAMLMVGFVMIGAIVAAVYFWRNRASPT